MWLRAARELRADLDRAGREMGEGLLGLAHVRLSGLERRWPGQPEVEYRLGLCELARGGRRGGAGGLGARPAGVRLRRPGGRQRATHLINVGRYAPAEAAARGGPPRRPRRRPGPRRPATRYDRLLRFEGRVDDVRRAAPGDLGPVARPGGRADGALAARQLPPARRGLAALARGRRPGRRPGLARPGEPGDPDRPVRRGRAPGSTPAVRRRPDDPAVWRRRLDLAARRPATPTWPGRRWRTCPRRARRTRGRLALRAWLAARRGDRRGRAPGLAGAGSSATPATPRPSSGWPTSPSEAGEADEAEAAPPPQGRGRPRQGPVPQVLLERGRPRRSRAGSSPASPRPSAAAFDARGWSLLAAAARRARPRPTRGRPDPGAPIGRHARRPAGRPGPLDEPAPGSPARRRPVAGRATDPGFADDAEAAGLRFVFDNGADPEPPAPRDDVGRRRPARLRRRRLARRLRRPGRARSRPAVAADPATATACSATGATAPSRTSPGGRASPPSPGATATASPSATTTTTAAPTCSSPAGGPTPSTATGATAPSRTRPAAPGLAGDRDWPTSAAFADLDGDGDLDLYVCHYLRLRPRRTRRLCRERHGRLLLLRPAASSTRPPDHVFRNDGGRFVDVTTEAGLRRPRRPGPGRGRRRPRRRRPGRPLRRQRQDGQLPLPQPRRASGSRRSGHAAGVAGQRRRRLPGGDGRRLRRPRRRRPARPGS